MTEQKAQAPATIVLQDEVWTDQPRLVAFTYPAKPVQDFINWLRTSKAWHEDATMVERRFTILQRELAAGRAALPAPAPAKVPLTAEQRKAISLANLAKARAARAAKHAAPAVAE